MKKTLILTLIGIFLMAGFVNADDSDGDGVSDTYDICGGTVLPEESVPAVRLRSDRYALTDGDTTFDTKSFRWSAPKKTYTTTDTCGCSCEQILATYGDALRGQWKYGCRSGLLDDFIENTCQADEDTDGYSLAGGDCNDNNHLIYPGAPEDCDGVDNDCNGEVDEGCVTCSGTPAEDPLVCSGHGTCTEQDVCECEAGYEGDDCSPSVPTENWFCGDYLFTECSACSGNGYCAYGGNCVCREGYTGSNCETVVTPPVKCNDIPATDPNVCSGAGTCVSDGVCVCNDGHSGTWCETDNTNTIDCSDIGGCGTGTCVGENLCECFEGWFGPTCNTYIYCFGSLSVDPNVCSGNGECVADETCECDEGWYGLDCSNPVICGGLQSDHPDVCSGRGTCLANGTCDCDYGFGGDECYTNIKSCGGYFDYEAEVCSNQGTCEDDGTQTWVCNCFPGWKGDFCDIPIICDGEWGPAACNGDHGTCVSDNVCECNFPYTGQECGEIVSCEGVPATDYGNVCSGFGQCMKNGQCACDEEHTGADCSLKIQCFGKDYDDPDVCGGIQICTKAGCIPDPDVDCQN